MTLHADDVSQPVGCLDMLACTHVCAFVNGVYVEGLWCCSEMTSNAGRVSAVFQKLTCMAAVDMSKPVTCFPIAS